MSVCRICRKPDCDDDCEELSLIYREQQREKLRDLIIDWDEPEDIYFTPQPAGEGE